LGWLEALLPRRERDYRRLVAAQAVCWPAVDEINSALRT